MAADPENTYLHFLDRELRLSVRSEPSEVDLLAALLTATALTEGRVFCSYSHLWESGAALGQSVAVIESLVRAGVLVPSSGYVTVEEFIDSRKDLYRHDQRRYPFTSMNSTQPW